MIVRFDDVHCGCNMDTLRDMTRLAAGWGASVVWAISVASHASAEGERVFPARFKALSDQRCFYRPDHLGIPPVPHYVSVASHGLLHLDHRLLSRETQELSILMSCSLLRSEMFVPPFNKWDANTESICAEHGIELVKFEDGWRSIEHEPFDDTHTLWYLHHRNLNQFSLERWHEGQGQADACHDSPA